VILTKKKKSKRRKRRDGGQSGGRVGSVVPTFPGTSPYMSSEVVSVCFENASFLWHQRCQQEDMS
jgi:hypothetical protein